MNCDHRFINRSRVLLVVNICFELKSEVCGVFLTQLNRPYVWSAVFKMFVCYRQQFLMNPCKLKNANVGIDRLTSIELRIRFAFCYTATLLAISQFHSINYCCRDVRIAASGTDWTEDHSACSKCRHGSVEPFGWTGDVLFDPIQARSGWGFTDQGVANSSR